MSEEEKIGFNNPGDNHPELNKHHKQKFDNGRNTPFQKWTFVIFVFSSIFLVIAVMYFFLPASSQATDLLSPYFLIPAIVAVVFGATSLTLCSIGIHKYNYPYVTYIVFTSVYLLIIVIMLVTYFASGMRIFEVPVKK